MIEASLISFIIAGKYDIGFLVGPFQDRHRTMFRHRTVLDIFYFNDVE